MCLVSLRRADNPVRIAADRIARTSSGVHSA